METKEEFTNIPTDGWVDEKSHHLKPSTQRQLEDILCLTHSKSKISDHEAWGMFRYVFSAHLNNYFAKEFEDGIYYQVNYSKMARYMKLYPEGVKDFLSGIYTKEEKSRRYNTHEMIANNLRRWRDRGILDYRHSKFNANGNKIASYAFYRVNLQLFDIIMKIDNSQELTSEDKNFLENIPKRGIRKGGNILDTSPIYRDSGGINRDSGGINIIPPEHNIHASRKDAALNASFANSTSPQEPASRERECIKERKRVALTREHSREKALDNSVLDNSVLDCISKVLLDHNASLELIKDISSVFNSVPDFQPRREFPPDPTLDDFNRINRGKLSIECVEDFHRFYTTSLEKGDKLISWTKITNTYSVSEIEDVRKNLLKMIVSGEKKYYTIKYIEGAFAKQKEFKKKYTFSTLEQQERKRQQQSTQSDCTPVKIVVPVKDDMGGLRCPKCNSISLSDEYCCNCGVDFLRVVKLKHDLVAFNHECERIRRC